MTLFTSPEDAEDFLEMLVFKEKEQFDKNEKQLIKGYKHPVTGKLVPVVKYFWTKKSWDGEPSLDINIQCHDEETYKKIRDIQRALNELGITFPTGYGGSRTWNFGASLSGYHFVRESQKHEYEFKGGRAQREFYPPLELVHRPKKTSLHTTDYDSSIQTKIGVKKDD